MPLTLPATVSTAPPVGAGRVVIVDLSEVVNNKGITAEGCTSGGGLNDEGMAFPAEALPAAGAEVVVGGVPFVLASGPAGEDNVVLAGQRLEVPPQDYVALHVLGVSEGGSFSEPMLLHGADGRVASVTLGLTDCRPHWGRPRFGEEVAVRFREMRFPPGDTHTNNGGEFCGLWRQRVPVDVPWEVSAIEMPDNPCMHVFALTLERR